MVCNVVMALSSFGPLADPIATGFGVDEEWVVLLQSMPHFTYFPMTFVTSYMFANMQPVNVFRCAPFFMIIGGWCRLLAFTGSNNFWIFFASNCVFTLAQPILLNGISIVTVSWFKEKERATATAIIGLGPHLGSLAGPTISGIFAKGLDKTDPKADLHVVK